MIEVHLHKGGGLLRLQKVGVGYYQVAYTNEKGETVLSPLFQEGTMAVKWAISLMERIAQAASPSRAG